MAENKYIKIICRVVASLFLIVVLSAIMIGASFYCISTKTTVSYTRQSYISSNQNSSLIFFDGFMFDTGSTNTILHANSRINALDKITFGAIVIGDIQKKWSFLKLAKIEKVNFGLFEVESLPAAIRDSAYYFFRPDIEDFRNGIIGMDVIAKASWLIKPRLHVCHGRTLQRPGWIQSVPKDTELDVSAATMSMDIKSRRWMNVDMDINGDKFEFIFDTGNSVTLRLSEKDFRRFVENNNLHGKVEEMSLENNGWKRCVTDLILGDDVKIPEVSISANKKLVQKNFLGAGFLSYFELIYLDCQGQKIHFFMKWPQGAGWENIPEF